MRNKLELSIVMPCLDEAETLQTCIRKSFSFLNKHNVVGEVIVADNGSVDGSQKIAEKLQAKVINVKNKGYGNALRGGIEVASGTYIIMADADDSYDFEKLQPFLEQLRNGFDLVMGNRFKGGIEKGAMPFLHKYLGNPVLSFLGRLFYKTNIGDFHCGLRGFSKEAYAKMDLKTTGMEFASEMIVKAKLNNLSITEVPTTLKPDGRTRKPHLNTWSDGWRHLRFLMLYAPNWLFLYPGIILVIIGFILSTILIFNPLEFKKFTLDIHTLLYTSTFLLIGLQFVIFFGLTKIFAVENGLLPKSKRYSKIFKYINLEKGLIVGFSLLVCGILLSIKGVLIWEGKDFGALNTNTTLKIVIPAVIALQLGIQAILFSLFFSILGLKNN
ncbi:glycosyltransferase family 2 protein [Hanstruepera marina]|uniref:glycosyltransferase family 2 protein n=1 Tax=Hanstruepera marina TaxID=2873265 RepID=UPI0021055ED1|nr:glycosyltransferase family 2 protein [Hanstruepera marina]